jgi:hypothetical protein
MFTEDVEFLALCSHPLAKQSPRYIAYIKTYTDVG